MLMKTENNDRHRTEASNPTSSIELFFISVQNLYFQI